MLIVYEHNESVCCQKVRITLAEKGIEHENRNISFENWDQRTPEFLALNPKGYVPVIVHDGKIVTESTIITEYLDDAFSEPPLMPKDPYWRARRRLWARWIDDEMHKPHISTISFNIAFTKLLKFQPSAHNNTPGGEHRKAFTAGIDSEPMRAALKAYQKFLIEMDRTLAENPWLGGPSYSLADIDVVPYIWRLQNLQLAGMWENFPRIQDWLDRVTERKSFRQTIVDTALPTWIGAMKENGEKAWPVIEKMLAEQ